MLINDWINLVGKFNLRFASEIAAAGKINQKENQKSLEYYMDPIAELNHMNYYITVANKILRTKYLFISECTTNTL